MNIRYHVELSEAERYELTALVGGGKHYARKIKRAQILLAADGGLSDDDIAAAVGHLDCLSRVGETSSMAALRDDHSRASLLRMHPLHKRHDHPASSRVPFHR
jgi:hypothetical protein